MIVLNENGKKIFKDLKTSNGCYLICDVGTWR